MYYQQFEEMDCGAACLRMVARAYGREYGLEELRERTGLSKRGVSLLGISEGAESIGLETLALPLSLNQLKQDVPLPCILPWRGNHFVVLYGIEDDTFYVADPDPRVQLTTLGPEELLLGWSRETDSRGEGVGNVLVLEPTASFKEATSERSVSLWRRLRPYLQPYRGMLLTLLVGLGTVVVIQIAVPLLIREMVDAGVVLDDPDFIWLVVIAQAVLLGMVTVLTAIRGSVLAYVGERTKLVSVSQYLSKLLRLPLAYFDSRSKGDLLQRINDHDRLGDLLSADTVLRLLGLVTFLAFTIVLAAWSWLVFALSLMGSALNVAWARYYLNKQRRHEQGLRGRENREVEQLIELVEGIADIKQYGIADRKRWAWERQRVERTNAETSTQSGERHRRTGSLVIGQVTALAITLVSATAVVQGVLTIGTLVAIHYLLAQMSNPVENYARLTTTYRQLVQTLERIEEVKTKQEERLTSKEVVKHLPGGALSLHSVSFRYNVPQAVEAMRNLTLNIPEGRVMAIVGASGSGKSTLLKLLLGFYTPTGGEILLGDRPLTDYPLAAWRERAILVNQESYLFTDSIAGNITMGSEPIDQERLLRAVQVTQIEGFIQQLPAGFATVVGPAGLGLSRGQRQRLLLARALYHRPAYLFLDEATSGLDAFMEVTIMDELLKYMQGSTVVIVAHRHATFERADHIVMLENGSLIEHGSHEQLMKDRQNYFRLVRNQTILGS